VLEGMQAPSMVQAQWTGCLCNMEVGECRLYLGSSQIPRFGGRAAGRRPESAR
jgi:hypothetical protein